MKTVGVSARLAWGVADQALSSLTNFALAIVVARAVAPRDFGAFALVFAAYLLALGVTRALTSEPLVVRYSASTDSSWRSGTASALGAVAALGVVLAAACLVVGVSAAGAVGAAFITLSVSLPGLLIQDAWRYAFFARQRGRDAFLNDLAWAIAFALSLLLLLATGHQSVSWFIAAWGGSASVAAILGAFQAQVLPSIRLPTAWWREHRDLATRFLGDFAVLSGAGQLVLYFVGAVAGLAAVGSLRAGQLLLGPLNVLFMGVGLFAIPEGVRVLAAAPVRFPVLSRLVSVTLAGSALVWTVALLVIPSDLGRALLKESWEPAQDVVLPLAIGVVGSGIASGAAMGLRSLGAARRTMRARLLVTPLILAGGVGGAIFGGAFGAAVGLAMASWVGAAVWWRQFLRGCGERSLGGATTRPIVFEAAGNAPGRV